jgi:hypothetical protein
MKLEHVNFVVGNLLVAAGVHTGANEAMLFEVASNAAITLGR